VATQPATLPCSRTTGEPKLEFNVMFFESDVLSFKQRFNRLAFRYSYNDTISCFLQPPPQGKRHCRMREWPKNGNSDVKAVNSSDIAQNVES